MSEQVRRRPSTDPLTTYSPDFCREELAKKEVFDPVFLLVNERIAELIDKVNAEGGRVKAITLTWKKEEMAYAPDYEVGYFQIKAAKA